MGERNNVIKIVFVVWLVDVFFVYRYVVGCWDSGGLTISSLNSFKYIVERCFLSRG